MSGKGKQTEQRRRTRERKTRQWRDVFITQPLFLSPFFLCVSLLHTHTHTNTCIFPAGSLLVPGCHGVNRIMIHTSLHASVSAASEQRKKRERCGGRSEKTQERGWGRGVCVVGGGERTRNRCGWRRIKKKESEEEKRNLRHRSLHQFANSASRTRRFSRPAVFDLRPTVFECGRHLTRKLCSGATSARLSAWIRANKAPRPPPPPRPP